MSGPEVGEFAPDFTLPGVQGHTRAVGVKFRPADELAAELARMS